MALATNPTAESVELTPIPLGAIVPWAIFAAAISMVLIYFFGVEQGALSVFSGSYVHEFVHDARHLAGLPCH